MLDAFTRFGNGFTFSSRPALGRQLYEQIKEMHGGSYGTDEFSGPIAGFWFAFAMAVARAYSTLERVKNQADPLKAYDLLSALEAAFEIEPEYGATVAQRREVLAAAMKLALGPARDNVVYQLRVALGADFVAWVTAPGADTNHYPREDVSVEYPSGNPEYPNGLPPWAAGATFSERPALGIFEPPPSWKMVRLQTPIDGVADTTLSLPEGYDVAVQRAVWTHVAGDTVPLYRDGLSGLAHANAPIYLLVAPGQYGRMEVVEVVHTPTANSIYAAFRLTHEEGTLAIRWPFPFWLSHQKHSLVVVKNGRARDPAIQAKTSALLPKLLGSTSTWDVVEENAAPGTTGPFYPGEGMPGITPVEEVTF